jgi:hypothetical protein
MASDTYPEVDVTAETLEASRETPGWLLEPLRTLAFLDKVLKHRADEECAACETPAEPARPKPTTVDRRTPSRPHP